MNSKCVTLDKEIMNQLVERDDAVFIVSVLFFEPNRERSEGIIFVTQAIQSHVGQILIF